MDGRGNACHHDLVYSKISTLLTMVYNKTAKMSSLPIQNSKFYLPHLPINLTPFFFYTYKKKNLWVARH
jgi:hypothetical protein